MSGELEWRRSSFCEATACVEVMSTASGVWLRVSIQGREIFIPGEDWRAFVEGVKAGEFDV